jgi:PAS domain S-box-containing protein
LSPCARGNFGLPAKALTELKASLGSSAETPASAADIGPCDTTQFKTEVRALMSENVIPATNPPKPRLLFVEDEATLREHLAERLADDYLVDTAGNGNEALLAVLRAKPALVVTDIVMPDMDGVELLKTLRQTPNTRSIPVLLISGRAAEDYRIEGFEEGADGFLAKPYTERELRALIGSMLRSARIRTDAAGREAREQAEQKAVIERAILLESITDAFFALDRQWRHTYVNQRALDYYDMQRADLLGRSLWEVFPAMQDTVFESQFRLALREQHSVSFEILAPVMERWLEVRAYPTPQGLAVNFRDISRRKKAEAELQRALVELNAREEQLRESQLQLALEVDSMRRLHELVNRLLGCDDLQTAWKKSWMPPWRSWRQNWATYDYWTRRPVSCASRPNAASGQNTSSISRVSVPTPAKCVRERPNNENA